VAQKIKAKWGERGQGENRKKCKKRLIHSLKKFAILGEGGKKC
jgi:hypothetical protein